MMKVFRSRCAWWRRSRSSHFQRGRKRHGELSMHRETFQSTGATAKRANRRINRSKISAIHSNAGGKRLQKSRRNFESLLLSDRRPAAGNFLAEGRSEFGLRRAADPNFSGAIEHFGARRRRRRQIYLRRLEFGRKTIPRYARSLRDFAAISSNSGESDRPRRQPIALALRS